MTDSQKVVLVTGGTRGIGAAIASAFAAEGHAVAVCGRKAPTDCPHAYFSVDVRDPDACAGLVSQVCEQLGRLDVLVNNAGGSPPSDSATASPRFSEKVVQLNLLAPLWLSQQANTVMQAQPTGGVIINIASIAGMQAAPTVAAYGAAKAGMLSLTKTHALEWAPKVRVAAVSPGLVATELALQYFGDQAPSTPMDRLATPQDVAQACTWLASDAASFVNGTNIVLDGGGDWPEFLRPKGES
jgi:NAD(P)-dependent dehydrogenase (short-subunit alcohol dehydrogenase family)